VTASVDAIELARPLDLARDMTIIGRVVWTGRSSLDIRMELHQQQEGDGQAPVDPSLVALFSFVALDPVTKKAIAINPLQVRWAGAGAGAGCRLQAVGSRPAGQAAGTCRCSQLRARGCLGACL
jgi:acyl-CoA hydrolase